MSRARNIRIALVPTDRTDLMCTACGGFRTQYAIDVPGREPQVGLHLRCIPALRVRGAPRGVAYALDDDSVTTAPTGEPPIGRIVAVDEPVPPGGNYAPPAPLRCLLCKAKPGTHLAGCPGDVAAQVQP